MRNRVFRALWIAVLVSNVGTYLQMVGAQWLLVNAAHAAILVALVTTADMLPDALFGLVGGVLADIFDRRRLLLVLQLGMGALAAVLASLACLGGLSPALVLALTAILGFSSVLSNPAYQSLAPVLTTDGQAGAAALPSRNGPACLDPRPGIVDVSDAVVWRAGRGRRATGRGR